MEFSIGNSSTVNGVQEALVLFTLRANVINLVPSYEGVLHVNVLFI